MFVNVVVNGETIAHFEPDFSGIIDPYDWDYEVGQWTNGPGATTEMTVLVRCTGTGAPRIVQLDDLTLDYTPV